MTDESPPALSGMPSFEALLRRPDLIWMGQNTTHLEPPAAVVDALRTSIERHEFQFYAPAAGFAELRELIVEDLGLPGSQAWVTDGAVSGLHQVCTVLAPRVSKLITSDPGWPWPARFVADQGLPVAVAPVFDTPERILTAAQIAAVIEPGSLLYLIDPLNPLGSSYTRDQLIEITDLARATGSYVVHDCTYRHFADNHTLAAQLYPERTITTYSFSKWLGIAGLRVGALVAIPELLATFTHAPANPLGAGITAQRAAIAGLRVKVPWLARVRAANRRNIEAIESVVAGRGADRIVVSPSQGNFVAIELDAAGPTSEQVCRAMLERNIFIRPGTYQSPRFGDRFVKVSTSVPPAWTDRFCAEWTALAARREVAR
ncbi:pyridoxal phosphate-dependent aminotransferase [Mycolicibacterium palauense]|uniref:pyridoxal phosphate-dependent aminotransferase n=1 Tax=Mycolicibacterium palauense TaxID=2034511 RepID=UPI000BFEEF2B|nr:pyridoxal phosphate-dependent aminotransferase [Mycolicibacterium palauense]